jgi:hypothetical protein
MIRKILISSGNHISIQQQPFGFSSGGVVCFSWHAFRIFKYILCRQISGFKGLFYLHMWYLYCTGWYTNKNAIFYKSYTLIAFHLLIIMENRFAPLPQVYGNVSMLQYTIIFDFVPFSWKLYVGWKFTKGHFHLTIHHGIASRSCCFTPKERAPVTNWPEGWVRPRGGLNVMEKNLFPLLGIEHRFLGLPAYSLIASPTELSRTLFVTQAYEITLNTKKETLEISVCTSFIKTSILKRRQYAYRICYPKYFGMIRISLAMNSYEELLCISKHIQIRHKCR